ncbi:MAG: hypothetical protein HQ481_18400 [Alphaproteobacteria bacterium]|nr:hypothetical protein [Alphaproteobacteria bacterium]
MIEYPSPDLILETIPATDPVERISQEVNIMAIEALLELVRSVDADGGYAKASDAARSLALRTGAIADDIERTLSKIVQ